VATAVCVRRQPPAGVRAIRQRRERPTVAGKSPRKAASKKPAGKTLKEKRSAKKLKSSDASTSIVPPTR